MTATLKTDPTPARPGQAGLRRWAGDHGVDVPPKGKISNATWARWDEWLAKETADARTKALKAHARVDKAYEAATEHVSKYFGI
jgi:hypothetical protein